jgi:octaprenyl-diphosphate synthase
MEGALYQSKLDRVDPATVVRRGRPAGVHADAPLTRVRTAQDAFALAGPALAACELRLAQEVGSEVAVVAAIGSYLAEAGGKRLRPLLTALGSGAVGYEAPIDGLMCVGEMIHLGSLLHDDVVDDGALRRGKPAAQRVYGNAAVILTGDFCLARAVFLAATEGGHAAVTRLAAAVTAMAEGEVLQLQRAGDLDTSLGDYLEMIDKKSAALIAWCASAGALAMGDAAAAEVLERYGRAVGVAFQITDDVLDYGGPTGKPPGQDLRERKLTLPLVCAMQRIPTLRPRLDAADADIPALAAEIRASGALDAALDEARARVDGALALLDALHPGPFRDALVVLGRYLVERTA